MNRILVICLVLNTVAADLTDQLHSFETLSHVDVNVRRKRSTGGHDSGMRDVTFTAFGRQFDMILTPGTPVITADFQVKLVYKNGHVEPFHINNNDFFTGHLSGHKDIPVDANTEDGLWSANIYDKDEIYTLEPSWRHLPPSDNYNMIVYRHSDIKWDNIFPDLNKTGNEKKSFCPGIHAKDDFDYNLEQAENNEVIHEKDSSRKVKRAAPDRNTCHVMAVADYTMFSGPGGGYPHRTANHIIQNMQKVNRIYRETVWSSELDLKNMGLQIKELRIHPELTDSSEYHSNGMHYNMHDGSTQWPYDDLLEQFGMDADVSKFCLAHLFTHRRFAGGVLGLAYIAPARKFGSGGICSHRSGTGVSYNIGFSSSMNTKGNHLLTQEAMLVTAHEFGHNFGAEHDAETEECAPNSFNNGRFIMFPYAVSGYDENNNKFSPCSKRYISAALSVRSDICFKAQEIREDTQSANVPLCGNGIIDTSEDCDGGGMGLSGDDPCCSATCKFIGNASCSFTNYECCKGCRLAPINTPCRGASNELCYEEAVCTGTSLDCPPSAPMRDNTPCIDRGQCYKGSCLDYCASAGQLLNKDLKPCRCEDIENSCLRCCKSADEVCRPLANNSQDSFLQDGRPCSYGYCESGKCHRTSSDMIQRLFDFIERLDSSTFVAFMRTNIVGTVIVFSLVLWIPLSWTISCIDKRRERKSKERLTDEEVIARSLQAAGFARQYKDYNVKESTLHRTNQVKRPWPKVTTEASIQPPYPREEKKYKFVDNDNLIYETSM